MKLNSIILPDNFLCEEERCGYRVTEDLKKVWAVELDLAVEFMRVCNKYGIKTSAFAGSILGAVRHKGFIPWDDDMDFCLTREEFQKLLKIPPKEFKYPYYLQTTMGDQRFFCPYARLRNSETTGIITWNKSPDYNNGIYIDIFVLDGFTESRFQYWSQFIRWSFLRAILENYNGNGKTYKAFDRYVNAVAKKIAKTKSYEKWVKKYNKIICSNTAKTERLSLITHGRWFTNRYCIYKSELEDTIQVPFENIDIPIPRAYDNVLKRIYGDYMQLPPVEQRGEWHNGKIIFAPDIPYKEYFETHPDLVR